MDWFLDFKVWSNANLYSIVPLTPIQRIERLKQAIVFKIHSRGCIIIYTDFTGKQRQKLVAKEN